MPPVDESGLSDHNVHLSRIYEIETLPARMMRGLVILS